MNLTTGPVFTAIIEREGNLYVALCPELDVASQGTSIENALENLKEAVALFIETADPGEMKERRREHVFVTQFPGRGWVGSASSPDARPVILLQHGFRCDGARAQSSRAGDRHPSRYHSPKPRSASRL